MRHLDLFSGIGGFAYAADQVWGEVEHIFCDNDDFCKAVLRKHWPESEIYDDIRQLIADADSSRSKGKDEHQSAYAKFAGYGGDINLITGGFPCQSFSQAGLRRGTADIRWLWPEMFEVIQLAKPTWVIAENVYGLLTWGDGVAFEQVCTDLESAGYEVQPFIVPAAAVGAPHRRDRIWFVAHTKDKRPVTEMGLEWQPDEKAAEHRNADTNAQDPIGQRRGGRRNGNTRGGRRQVQDARSGWQRNWTEVAAELCSVDDGLPAGLGELKLTKAQHRDAQIKAYGNAIVPQVAMQIMEAIKLSTPTPTR